MAAQYLRTFPPAVRELCLNYENNTEHKKRKLEMFQSARKRRRTGDELMAIDEEIHAEDEGERSSFGGDLARTDYFAEDEEEEKIARRSGWRHEEEKGDRRASTAAVKGSFMRRLREGAPEEEIIGELGRGARRGRKNLGLDDY